MKGLYGRASDKLLPLPGLPPPHPWANDLLRTQLPFEGLVGSFSFTPSPPDPRLPKVNGSKGTEQNDGKKLILLRWFANTHESGCMVEAFKYTSATKENTAE
ncbi:hypothetical protein ZHAS_00003239 [Anopheles sinensis]|uniref:Uncharacterized protein n=1 Tax=Anopheles sinensis TaxID=74873 RepID=A0A084VDX7_ANOSI|nr:hypothetical protein ZHAS_00003239 [Anopheles sinensis]